MSEDDVLLGYRLQLFDDASRTTVSQACRTFGVHRSTSYRWKRMVERHGLEVLRPRERRRPNMPNQLPAMVEERIVAFAVAHPGLGPRRIASQPRREKWGRIVVSGDGVWRCLRRHGRNTRSRRLSLSSPATARPTSLHASPPPSRAPRSTIRESWSASTASSSAGSGHEGRRLAADRDRLLLLVRLGRARRLPRGQPTATQASRLARRVARELEAAGWRLQRCPATTATSSRARASTRAWSVWAPASPTSTPAVRRPTVTSRRCTRHLDERWRPAFARSLYPRFPGLRRELERYLDFYDRDCVHHGRLTRGRPADVVYGARKMEAR
ncbi:MAG: hypothetical protein C4307_01380 [Chloroflexota bacterium]